LSIKNVIMSELLRPFARRLGTMLGASIATYLASQGTDPEVIKALQAGLVALFGVSVDLLNSHLDRKGR
jgi:hypothetical protein